MQPLQTTTVYTPPTMKIQQTPNTISVGKGNNLGKNNNSGNLMNTVTGALSTGLSSYGSTGSVGQGVSSTVDSLIKSIPVAGQIISAVDMITDPLASAFGDAGATNPYNQAAERLFSPLNSLESGISNLIDGNSKEGWNDLIGVVLPGLAGYNDAKWEREKRSADASRERVLLNEKDKQRDVQQGYGWRYRDQPMQAAYGGYLGYNDDVLGQSFEFGGELLEMGKGGKIYIKPENRGKFTEYKQRTGKTTEEALHSKDPHVRQMANFARNARHWKHEFGGDIEEQSQVINSNPQITEYNEGDTHDMNTSGYGGVPVDASGNRTVVSANRPVATVEEGEVSWFNPNSKTTYVFSNKIRL